MNEYNRHDYAGRPTRSTLVGVGLALLKWLDELPEQVDPETGEKVRVLVTDGEALIVPAAITRKITPEISKTALMTIEDERRYHAQKGVG